MTQYRWLNFTIVFLLVVSCGKKLPDLNGVDTALWQQDKNGCAGQRLTMRGALETEKEKLKGLDEMAIVKLLGKPDENELYKRNQKFYYYHLRPAKACNSSTDTLLQRLVIRFNAMGLAKDVTIE